MDSNRTGEIPEYVTLTDSFFEPNPVLKGSIVRGTFSPGPHLKPLNKAAERRMEEWYTEEYDEIDVKTRQPTGKKFRPHEAFRIATYTPGERHDAVIVSGPPKDMPGSLTLAESFQGRQSTDQRPPPAVEQRIEAPVAGRSIPEAPTPPQSTEPVITSEGMVVTQEGDGPPVVDVVSAAKPPSAKKIS